LVFNCNVRHYTAEGEVDDMSGHVIIAGYGRTGHMIAELLGKVGCGAC